jgi:hypothetical protein
MFPHGRLLPRARWLIVPRYVPATRQESPSIPTWAITSIRWHPRGIAAHRRRKQCTFPGYGRRPPALHSLVSNSRPGKRHSTARPPCICLDRSEFPGGAAPWRISGALSATIVAWAAYSRDYPHPVARGTNQYMATSARPMTASHPQLACSPRIKGDMPCSSAPEKTDSPTRPTPQ